MKRGYEIALWTICIGVTCFLLGLWIGVEICASASSIDITSVLP